MEWEKEGVKKKSGKKDDRGNESTRKRKRAKRSSGKKDKWEFEGGKGKKKKRAPEIFGTKTLSLNGPQRDWQSKRGGTGGKKREGKIKQSPSHHLLTPFSSFLYLRPLRSHHSFVLCHPYSFFISNIVTNCFTLRFIMTPLSSMWKNYKALMAGNGIRGWERQQPLEITCDFNTIPVFPEKLV